MTATAPPAPTAPGVRSWWGIPYATAERYRRPVLAAFDPERVYDRKGVVRGGRDNQAMGVVLDTEQPAGVLHAHPLDVLASGTHRDVDVLLSMASDDMGWWVANDLDRFDPHTVDRVIDEAAGRRVPRSRAQKFVGAYDQGGRTPAEVRSAVLSDYIHGLPAVRGTVAHAAAGGNAHLLVIGPAEGAPAVHGSEMYVLVGQERPGRSAEQAERDTRITGMLFDFATGDHTRLWPAVSGRPIAESVGHVPFDAGAHYQAALDLFQNIPRP
ncbi:hypothetical protein [Streptomyces sp. NPDC095613]|uniref:hypothetical protein n=1 Tax=Streptomyces sp. NPDC095613 TaxID=3155540 RepID=UPI0033281142